MTRRALCGLAFLIAAVCLSACVVVTGADPIAVDGDVEAFTNDERLPLDLRRTTLLVRDLEASLALYRDALGMEVSYDQILTSRDGSSQSRLVLLKANDPMIGMLGLWELPEAADAPTPQWGDGFAPGEIVLLFNTSDLDTVFPAAAASEGVTVISEPTYREYPGDGVTYQVMVSMLRDPDGHIVELNNRLSPPMEWD